MINISTIGQRPLIFEGTSKNIYDAGNGNLIMQYSSNGDNDVWRNYSSCFILEYLTFTGINNHFLQRLNMKEQLIKASRVLPVFATVYNIASTEMQRRIGIMAGTRFHKPLIEWRFKSKKLKNPVVSMDHIRHFNWVTKKDIEEILHMANRANDILQAYFYSAGIQLGEISLEFGCSDEIMIVDEISPDTCTFWDIKTTEPLQKSTVYNQMKNILNSKISGNPIFSNRAANPSH